MKKTVGVLAALLAAGVLATGALAANEPLGEATRGALAQEATADIVDTAVAAGSFTTLATALEAAGLVDTLKGPGPFTVFAPTDDAFAALPAGTLDSLLADPDALADVLLYHVVSGSVDAATVVGLTEAETVNGATVDIAVDGGTVMLNGDATVTTTDIMASNGIIHVIDAVLIPPAAGAVSVPAPADSGNAGLVASDGGTNWMLLVLLGVAAVAVVGSARMVAARARSDRS